MSNDIRRRPEGALLRTYLTAAGVSPDSFSKPLIGVATASSQVFSEKADAKELGDAAIEGIHAAGGLAVRWDTVRTPELMAWGHAESYSFAWRDQLADFIESWARQEALDGLVLVGDAPETLVGMAMAAARLNIPAVCVPVASHRWEYSTEAAANGKKKDFSDPFELLSERLFGGVKPAAGDEAFTRCLLAHDDHEANAIYLAMEALGICLPGASTVRSKTNRQQQLAKSAGDRVVALVKSGYSVRRALSLNSFSNAIRLNAALGGSVDVAVHLMALAHESGTILSLDLFDKIARETAQVSNLGGVNVKAAHGLEDFDRAGGVWAVLSVFKNAILPSTTVSGRGAMDLVKGASIKDSHVVASNRPIHKQSGLGVIKGNLTPRGAVFLLNQVLPDLSMFKGPAVVFDNELDAAAAVHNGTVKKGQIIVVRGQGPRGGPGLRKLRILPALMESRGLHKSVPLLTDGRLPDTPAGLFISFASPEGAVKGPMAVLKSGDMIDIDVAKRQMIVRLTETDLQVRYARWQPEAEGKGFLGRYSRLVSEAHEGAVLK